MVDYANQKKVKVPKTLEDAEELLQNPDLHRVLEQRLVQLAFSTSNSAVAYRSIELLLSRARVERPEPLDNLSDEKLKDLDARLSDLYEAVFDDVIF